MTRTLQFRFAVVASVLAWITPAASAQVATLSLQSQPGDFIGQGQTVTINYPPNEITAQIRRTLAGGAPAELLFVLGHVTPSPNTFALLFSAPINWAFQFNRAFMACRGTRTSGRISPSRDTRGSTSHSRTADRTR